MVLSFRFYVLGARGAGTGVARGMLSICVRAFWVINLFFYAKFFSFQDLRLHVRHDECRSVRIAGPLLKYSIVNEHIVHEAGDMIGVLCRKDKWILQR
jgi:hypothetical protein